MCHFYELACEKWQNLQRTDVEQMKYAMLEVVSETVSRDHNQKKYFGEALYDIIVLLMEKKDQKISKDKFVNVMFLSRV